MKLLPDVKFPFHEKHPDFLLSKILTVNFVLSYNMTEFRQKYDIVEKYLSAP